MCPIAIYSPIIASSFFCFSEGLLSQHFIFGEFAQKYICYKLITKNILIDEVLICTLTVMLHNEIYFTERFSPTSLQRVIRGLKNKTIFSAV